jgi:hypothetical protein
MFELGIGLHIGVEEFLIERASVHTDTKWLIITDSTLYELLEVVVMAISLSDIAWIDSVLGDRLSHLWIPLEEDMSVEVKVSDNWRLVSLLTEGADNIWNRECCSICIDRDTDDLGTCICEFNNLCNRCIDIPSRSIGHRLDDNWMI